MSKAQVAGTLDSSFNNIGVNVTVFPLPAHESHATSVITLNDQRIVVCGFTDIVQSDIALARYLPDGQLDSTFGDSGILVIPTFTTYTRANDLAVLPNGNIIVVGTIYDAGNVRKNCLVMAIDSTGSIDSSFGTFGYRVFNFSSDNDYFSAVETSGEDEIFIVGNSVSQLGGFVLKLTDKGSIDSTFGTNGIYIDDYCFLYDLKTLQDHKILVCGDDGDYLLSRITSSGTIDSSFGNNGYAERRLWAKNSVALSIDTLSDGRIIIGASYHDSEVLLARFSKNGFLDDELDNDGIKIVHECSTIWNIKVTAHPSGKMILTGTAKDTGNFVSTDQILISLNNDGSLDSSFGVNGITRNDFNNGYNVASSACLQAGGKIIVAGSAPDSSYVCDQYFCVSRFAPPEIVSAVSNLKNESRITFFPNPASDFILINFQLKENSRISFNLYDRQLKLLFRTSPQPFEAGDCKFKFSFPPSIRSGLYFMEIRGDNLRESFPIIKVAPGF
ncbi:MAG: hypothetical protein K1X63_08720 [Chitinophagales bacterium]|nr:hypothetical protein [Chitinophagales bacterium]